MTGLSILALLAGLACIPVLDPDSRRWLRALVKARRERPAQLPPRRRARTSSGPPLHERMFPPPGSSGYRPTRKVNPATIQIPRSPSAVTPPSPLRAAELTAMVNDAKTGSYSVDNFLSLNAMLRERLSSPPRKLPAPKPVSGTRRM